MNALAKSVCAMIVALATVPAAQAGNDLGQAADACKAEVSSRYAVNGEEPRVSFDGTRGVGKAMKLRIRVYPEQEAPFNALCQIDRNSGMVIAVTSSKDDAYRVVKTD